jgi:hypothetical protein
MSGQNDIDLLMHFFCLGRCVRFVEDFRRDDDRVYMNLLQKVANRELKSVTINLDDVLSVRVNAQSSPPRSFV